MTPVIAALTALAVLSWPARRPIRALRSRLRAARATPPPRWRSAVRSLAERLGAWPRHDRSESDLWLPVLDQLAAGLRAGLPPAEALALTTEGSPSSVGAQLETVLGAAREGRPCAPAWMRIARVSARTELELLARSWAISEQLGAPLADAVDSAARSARAHREFSGALDTATAGARTTATLLTLLPLAGIGIALTMGIGPSQLYGSPVALVSLLAGLSLIGVGRVVVAGMVDRVAEST